MSREQAQKSYSVGYSNPAPQQHRRNHTFHACMHGARLPWYVTSPSSYAGKIPVYCERQSSHTKATSSSRCAVAFACCVASKVWPCLQSRHQGVPNSMRATKSCPLSRDWTGQGPIQTSHHGHMQGRYRKLPCKRPDSQACTGQCTAKHCAPAWPALIAVLRASFIPSRAWLGLPGCCAHIAGLIGPSANLTCPQPCPRKQGAS